MSTPETIPGVDRPRYCGAKLPPYSYVPKHAPHPVSDPAGHWFGREEPTPTPLDPAEPNRSDAYLYGIDLFNHGYYWEAHEAWESLWHAAGRTGVTADWLKSLIKLAAALVKAREGNPRGVERHARRTLELLDIVTAQLPGSGGHYCGLSLARVEAIARGLVSEAATHYTEGNPAFVLRGWLEIN